VQLVLTRQRGVHRAGGVAPPLNHDPEGVMRVVAAHTCTTCAPMKQPVRAQASSGRPARNAERKPAVKRSPAPVVSLARTVFAGTATCHHPSRFNRSSHEEAEAGCSRRWFGAR
jgi:hypothetical protein